MGQIASLQEEGSHDHIKKMIDFTATQLPKYKFIRERFELLCDENQGADRKTFQQLVQIDIEIANKLFDIFDSDKSGTVDYAEFITGLALFSHSTLTDKAEILFNVYDSDASHVLEKKELIGLLGDCCNALCSMASQVRPTQDQINTAADAIIQRWDTEKDDTISKDEFKSIVTKDPDVLKCLMSHGLINPEEMRKDFGGRTDGIPDCDSDLEEEISKEHIDPIEYARKQRIKDGVDYKLDKDKAADNIFNEEHIESGDEFMAVKPWVGTVKATVPSGYKPSKTDALAPEATLELEYVFGYRCHDTRNNLRYNTKGEAVYHTAAVGISLDGKTNTQRFFIQHNDDITCLDICGDMVVTGQMGRKPLLCVWDSVKMTQLACFQGELEHSHTNCCFSSDGKLVAAIANDPDHTIGIYNLSNFTNPNYNKVKAKTDGSIILGKGPKAEILDMKFDPSNKMIVITCVKEVDFVTFEGGVIKVVRGSGFPKDAPQQAISSVAFCNGACLTGAFNGSIYVWKGNAVTNTLTGHKGNVNALWSRAGNNGFISGGNDGLIIVWDSNFKPVQTIDVAKLEVNSMNPKIRSVCDNKAGNILFGTRGGEIIELVGQKASVLMRGHYDEELWGLCVHPNKNVFYTVGQDTMLASWDIASRKQKAVTKLDYKATAIAASPDQKYLAVGCMNGMVLIIDPNNFKVIQTVKDRDKQISDMKFSPNSELLAVGAHDSETHIYNVSGGFKLQARARGHHSTIRHIDFARDSQFLQSVCTSYELLFFNTNSGKRQNAPQFKDEPWASWTTIIGWPVQGIWPECSKGSDINAVDRHPSGTVMATADDFSQVKLFRFPCPIERSAYVKYVGHSSHVTNVRFTNPGDYLLSTGGNDKAIFQWKYIYDHQGEQAVQNIHGQEEGEAETGKEEDQGGMFQQEKIEGGDEALAVKPFKGQVEKSIPEAWKKAKKDPTPPNGNLTLAYCHGYRCFDAKNAAQYTDNPNNIVFIAAALGVTQDIKTRAQSFYNLHDDDVVSLAIHPNRKLAATGQMAHKGKAKQIDMFVWDIEQKTMLSRMNNFHLRAVTVLSFSPDGSKLASYGRDDNNSLAVYDWAQGMLLATSKVDQAFVTASGWRTETEFFSCGVKHVKIWTLNGKNISGKRASLPTDLQNEAFVSGIYVGDLLVCGTAKGLLIPFNGGTAGKSITAHKGSVDTVIAISAKKQLISGGQDGKVIVWSCSGSLSKVSEFCDMATFTIYPPGVVSLDFKNDGETLLVGTKGGEVHEVSKGKNNVLIQGHFDGELWGLACAPDKLRYVTCGGDATVRLWDATKFAMVCGTQVLENDLRGIDWASNGKFIVAGDMKGKIILLDPENLKILSSLQSGFTKKDQWIEDIKVSPDNSMVAFGAHGGCSPIEVMHVKDGNTLQKWKRIDVALTSALLHLDWAKDCSAVVVNSQAYELMFVSIQTGKQITASSSTTIEWATWTCKLGWCVQGVFKGVEYFGTHTVDRAHNQKVLVTGDDDSLVSLYRYPSLIERAQYKGYIGHSSHVTRTRFSFDDSKVFSTGGNDKCVIVWNTDFGAGHPEEQDIHAETPDNSGPVDDTDVITEKKKKGSPLEETKKKGEGELFETEEVKGGDEFLAIKPWIGQMKDPTDYKKPPLNQNKPPKADLTLEYVHGYRAKDCKNNVRYLKSGGIVYHAAALGIVLDPSENTQRFFNLHIDDITSMDVHPNGVLVATGEIGPHPTIYVWDSNTMQAVFTLKGLEKGVSNLGFSPDGSKLVGCAVDDNHNIAVFDTQVGALICKEKGDVSPILEIAFKNENEFVSVGPKHYMYWNFQNRTIKNKRGQFGSESMMLRCVAFNKDTVLAGTAEGKLQLWSGTTVTKSLPLHSKALDAIWVDKDYVITGGADGVANIMDLNYNVVLKFTLESICKDAVDFGLRSACVSDDRKSLLIGTFGSEIYELNSKDTKFSNGTKFTPKSLIKGHYTPNAKWTNEVWGLCIFHDGNTWATCSDDATIRLWSTKDRKMIKLLKLDIDENGNKLPPDEATGDFKESAKTRSVDVSPDDKLLVIGCKDGTVRVVDVDAWKQIKIIKDSKAWIQEIKFNPAGDQIALGAHDQTIYLYNVPNFALKHKMKKHSSYITHIDWSKDGMNLHSTCGAYELLYWDAGSGKQITSGASQFRDKNEDWATWTCTLGWPVQGIWPPCSDGTMIHYVDRSHSTTPGGYKILALGDNFSKVHLFRYPSLAKGSESVEGRGHSSHITNVKWGNNDEYLYSAGGEDNCVFQWKVAFGN